jgi:hypothetical protein
LAGCGSQSRRAIVPEPVSFVHDDEIVRGEGFIILADRRTFALMAFLNATGYDDEAKGQTMHPVRIRVRQLVQQNLDKYPQKAAAFRRYADQRHVPSFQYQDYALSLSADYPFHRIRTDAELNYAQTADTLRDFPGVLNDFWETADLAAVWAKVKPDFVAEIHKYDFARMQRQMTFLWEYLRMPRRDSFTLVNIPNLLDTHFMAIGARYENYYFSVESPGSHDYSLNTHEYLHSIVNRLADPCYSAVADKIEPYYQACLKSDFSKSYGSPTTFVSECLVRALDHRIRIRLSGDPEVAKRTEGQVTGLTARGLSLTDPFYRLLADYEKSDASFDNYIPRLFQSLPDYAPPSGP